MIVRGVPARRAAAYVRPCSAVPGDGLARCTSIPEMRQAAGLLRDIGADAGGRRQPVDRSSQEEGAEVRDAQGRDEARPKADLERVPEFVERGEAVVGVEPGKVTESLVLLATDPTLLEVLLQPRQALTGGLPRDLEVHVGRDQLEAFGTGDLLLLRLREAPPQIRKRRLLHRYSSLSFVAFAWLILPLPTR